MNKPYAHRPETNGAWLILDIRAMFAARILCFWQLAGGFGITKDVIPPWFITATYDEATNTLCIRGPERFEVIMGEARDSLKAFYDMMEEEQLEQLGPLVVLVDSEDNSSPKQEPSSERIMHMHASTPAT